MTAFAASQSLENGRQWRRCKEWQEISRMANYFWSLLVSIDWARFSVIRTVFIWQNSNADLLIKLNDGQFLSNFNVSSILGRFICSGCWIVNTSETLTFRSSYLEVESTAYKKYFKITFHKKYVKRRQNETQDHHLCHTFIFSLFCPFNHLFCHLLRPQIISNSSPSHKNTFGLLILRRDSSEWLI